MSNFSINQQIFIVPLGNEPDERKKIEAFMSLLSESGIESYLSNWKSSDSKKGHPECNPYMMMAAILLSFSIDGGRLRDIESRCRFDTRFIYFMAQETPSHSTFCKFLNQCVLPNRDGLFSKITSVICARMGIGTCAEAFVDGTKIEANANKYKFVWKPDRKMRRLLEKATDECMPFCSVTGLEGHGPVQTLSELAARLSEEMKKEGIDVHAATKGKEKPAIVVAYLDCVSYLERMSEYQEQCEICGKDRNSYYKTDHDATAMCLKEDYYSGLGSNMHAGYNIQAAVSKGIVLSYYVSQDRSDYKTLPILLERHRMMYGSYPSAICADAGYGGVANYGYLKEKGIENYVKTSAWEGEISGKRPALYRLDDNGEIFCLFGKKAVETQASGKPKAANAKFYTVRSCRNCIYKKYCKKGLKRKGRGRTFEINVEFMEEKNKAFKNLLSPKGIEMRVNRSIQAEGTFGIIKQDMRYERFRRRGLEKASMEVMLNFLGLNIRKYLNFVVSGKNPDYWKAPNGLEEEKPHRISCAVKKGGLKKKKIEPNQKARKEYRRKSK